MFNFVVKYLGALKLIPFFALIFEGFMILQILLTKPQVLDYIGSIEDDLLKWDSITTKMHKYGGLQFNLGKKELGHIHGNGLLDVRLSKKMKGELLPGGRIKPHHFFNNSGWVSFYITNEDDVTYAIYLLGLAYRKIRSGNL